MTTSSQILPTHKGQLVKYFIPEIGEENMVFVVKEIYTDWRNVLCVTIQCINSTLSFPPINSMDATHLTVIQ